MRVGVSELDALTYDYLLHREERMEQQWNSRYNSLAEILEEAEEEMEEEEMESIRADYAALGDLFSQVTANYEEIQNVIQEGASQGRIDTAIELEERLLAQLLITSHTVITDASGLAEGARAEVGEAQRLASNLTLGLMIGLAIVVTTSSLLVARSISKPLDELTRGAEIIGKGDLEHRVGIKTKDELGQLAAAFNEMTESLKKTTASRDELEREVTERKRSEEALRDAQEQLVRQEKLAILGQLAGGVGHDLRNPLSAIKNAAYFLNMVLEEPDPEVEEPDPEVKETLEILEKEVGTSEAIISSLLDFARAKSPTKRKISVNEILQETLSRTAVPNNIEVLQEISETLPKILADPDQLGQVFGNVILNGIQAMTEGGQLTIKSEAPAPGRISVSITDTGVGIPEEQLNKLFEPLYTSKAKGIGLGLAIVKILVEGHGGTIEVESEPGKGSTFTVKLPTGMEES